MSSTLVAPLLISEPFGKSASNPTYIRLPIPIPDQTGTVPNQASFETGFPPSTMTPAAGGGLPPEGQDMNGILWMITAYCANLAAGKFQPWSSTLSSAINGYPLGALVLNANSNGYWLSTVDGNTTNPDTGGAGWQPVAQVGYVTVPLSSTNVTLTALQGAIPAIELTGTISANINVNFPANPGQQWIVANNTVGAHTVTVSTTGGTPITIPQTGTAAPTSIYSDGVNIYNTGVSTAGLAPIASPALTGTPTAPTATPATTSTTQIATTAFAQAAISAALSGYALLPSPTFPGNPTAPTQASSDSSTKLATTAFVHAIAAGTVSLTGNGYQKFASGLILQWGSATFTPSGLPVTFPIPFPTVTHQVLMSLYQAPGGVAPATGISSVTNTGFVGSVGTGGGLAAAWLAIGH